MISHRHETVFVHIPKCGGQSIETLFLDALGLDWSTRHPLLLRPNDDPMKGPPRLAHLLASEYVELGHMPADMFLRFFKFALVRNPYERALSFFNYLSTDLELDAFIMEWLPGQFALCDSYRTHPHGYAGMYHFVRPQVDFLRDQHGRVLVDHLFRLEQIDLAVPQILDRCGLRSTLRHINRSRKTRASRSDLKASHIEMINRLYKQDFVLLEYPMAG